MTEDRERNSATEREPSTERVEVKDMSRRELLESYAKGDSPEKAAVETGERTLKEYKQFVEKHNGFQKELDETEKRNKEKEILQEQYEKAQQREPGKEDFSSALSELEETVKRLRKEEITEKKGKKMWSESGRDSLFQKVSEELEKRRKEEEASEEKIKEAKKRIKKTNIQLDFLSKNEALVKAYSIMSARESLKINEESEEFEELKKKLGEDVLQKLKGLKEEKKKLSAEISKEKQREGLSDEQLEQWKKKVEKLEKKEKRITREVGRESLLSLLNWEYKEIEINRKEVVSDFQEEGAYYEQRRDEKGMFSGKELRATEEQIEGAKKEMKKEQRGRSIKRGISNFLFSFGNFLSDVGWFAWEKLKSWAGVKDKEK